MLALLFLRTARHAVGAPPVGALKWVGTGVAPMMFTPPAQGRAPYERMAMRLYNRETLLSTEEGREGLLQFLLGYTTRRTSRCRYASTILQELYHGGVHHERSLRRSRDTHGVVLPVRNASKCLKLW